MGKDVPPSTQHGQFSVGRNSRGQWVVQDEGCRCGGLFVDRTQALKFALFENGHDPQAVIMVPGVFELNLTQETEGGSRRDRKGMARAA